MDGRVRWQHGRWFFGGLLPHNGGRLGVLRLHNDGRWQSDGRLGGLLLSMRDNRLGGRRLHGRPLVDVPSTAVVGGPKTVAKAPPPAREAPSHANANPRTRS